MEIIPNSRELSHTLAMVKNRFTSALGIISASALITGGLLWLIASSIAGSRGPNSIDADAAAYAAATAWQMASGVIVGCGAIALIVYLLARSVAVELEARFAPIAVEAEKVSAD